MCMNDNIDIDKIRTNRERQTYINDYMSAVVGKVVESVDMAFYGGKTGVCLPCFYFTAGEGEDPWVSVAYDHQEETFTVTYEKEKSFAMSDCNGYRELRMEVLTYCRDILNQNRETLEGLDILTLYLLSKYLREEDTIVKLSSDLHTTSFITTLTSRAIHSVCLFDNNVLLAKNAELFPEEKIEVPEGVDYKTEHNTSVYFTGLKYTPSKIKDHVGDLMIETGNWNILK